MPSVDSTSRRLTFRWVMRPWAEFCDTNSFKAPSDYGRLHERILDNLQYFFANYCIVLAAVTGVGVPSKFSFETLVTLSLSSKSGIFKLFSFRLFDRSLLVPAGFASGLYAVLFIVLGGNQKIGDLKVEDMHKWIVFASVLALVIFLTETLMSLFWCIGVGSLVIVAHAAVRSANLRIKASRHAQNLENTVVDQVEKKLGSWQKKFGEFEQNLKKE